MPFGLTPIDQLPPYGSSITITETTGVGTDQPRTLVLYGSGLPFMGAEWGSENGMVTTWYPGNGVEATQQVLGPRELPSSWEGEWKRTLLGRTPCVLVDGDGQSNRIVSPHVLREVLEDIMRGGQRLRVTWAVRGTTRVGGGERGPDNKPKQTAHEENVTILREGRIKSFRTPIDRHTDIRWTCEFHWVSRGGTADRVASVREDSDLASIANGVEASINATSQIVADRIFAVKGTIRKSANRLTLGQLESLADAPTKAVEGLVRNLRQNVNDFKRIGEIARKLRSQPLQMANALVDFARNTVAIANNFIDQEGRFSAEQKTLKSKVTDLTRAARLFGSTTEAATQNARTAHALELQVKKTRVSGGNRGAISVRESSRTRAGDIIAIHITKTGDTPQTLSRRYYATADRGEDILRANRLPGYQPTFRPGTVLIIPVVANAPRGA